MAVKALQEVGEVFLVRLLEQANMCTIQAKRVTIMTRGYTISQKDQGGYLRGIVYSLTLQFYAMNYFFRPFDNNWLLFVVLCLFLMLYMAVLGIWVNLRVV